MHLALCDEAVRLANVWQLESARIMLDEAWARATLAHERDLCHTIGNLIQVRIFQRMWV
jgi:hypothetical protein